MNAMNETGQWQLQEERQIRSQPAFEFAQRARLERKEEEHDT